MHCALALAVLLFVAYCAFRLLSAAVVGVLRLLVWFCTAVER